MRAGGEKGGAFGGGLDGSERIGGTRGCGVGEFILLRPQAGPGQEAVFQAGAGELLEVGVGKVVFLNGANEFVGEVNAGDAFVIG